MKSLKSRWEKELDSVVPSLNDEVLNAPIVCEKKEKPQVFSKNRIIASVTAFVLTLCCIIASIPLFIKDNSSVVLVEINPKVTFSVNNKGMVTGVVGANADADIILASEQREKSFIGISVEDAVEKLVDYSCELGFIKESESAIRVSGAGDKNLLNKIENKVTNYFISKGIYGVVLSEEVSIAEFCTRSGLDGVKSVKDLTENIVNQATLYTERLNDGYEEVKNLIDKVSGMLDVPNKVKSLLIDNKTKLEIFYQDILEITEIDVFNPSAYLTLREKIQSLTQKYSLELGGDPISSYGKICEYEFKLKTLLESIDSYDEIRYFAFKQFDLWALEKVGVDTSEIEMKADKPHDKNGHLSSLNDCFEGMKNKNKENYEKEREEIKGEDYNKYKDDIIREHGSLHGYFEKINKK